MRIDVNNDNKVSVSKVNEIDKNVTKSTGADKNEIFDAGVMTMKFSDVNKSSKAFGIPEQDISADDFQQYYFYGGKMYTEMAKVTAKMVLDSTQEIEAIEGGLDDAYVRPETIPHGTVCCVPKGQRISMKLGSPMYIQFTDSRGSYKTTNKVEYDNFYKGHPDMKGTPGIDMSSGSLGQGISAACGMALAAKLDNKD